MNYYDQNFQAFVDNTLVIDMNEYYSVFLKNIDKGSTILDIGCGAGRDLKYFKENGYQPVGLEPCEKLAAYAHSYSCCDIENQTIQSYLYAGKFDAIWACASLLHLSDDELKIAFSKIKSLCHRKSIIYCSFKHGDFQGERSGRYFNDKTIKSLSPLLSGFKIEKHWITPDKRIDRSESWLNVILLSLGN